MAAPIPVIQNQSFDYIVVGGGSAGSIVAAELSADPSLRVLLLECGESADANPETLRADGYKDAFVNDRVIWERFSEPQPECGNNRLFMGSGRGQGGSGAVNAMVYTRGAAADWDEWKVKGWGWSDVVPSFVELEQRLDVRRLPATRFTEACIAGAVQSGFRRKEDLNDGDLSTVLGYEWMNLRGNERRSSYVAFLRGVERPNLTVLTSALGRRILFASGAVPRAVGVEYEQEGRVQTASATREVILCAGALETPKLLMLSGVGPVAELERHGIPVVAAQPGVGQNLQDHPNVQLFFLGKKPTDTSWAQLYGFARALPQSTTLATSQSDSCYVFYSARSSFKEGVIRLLPSMILPPALYRWGWLRRGMRRVLSWILRRGLVTRLIDRMWGIVVILGKPRSRGTLRLGSRDVRQQALLAPGYFRVAEDLDAVIAGVALARKIAASPALDQWGNRPLIPSGKLTGPRLDRWIRKSAITTYHYAGTCRMGDDDAAVVDGELRVRGVQALRIADASIIPVVPVSAMNAPSMLIGLRASRLIRAAQSAAPVAPQNGDL